VRSDDLLKISQTGVEGILLQEKRTPAGVSPSPSTAILGLGGPNEVAATSNKSSSADLVLSGLTHAAGKDSIGSTSTTTTANTGASSRKRGAEVLKVANPPSTSASTGTSIGIGEITGASIMQRLQSLPAAERAAVLAQLGLGKKRISELPVCVSVCVCMCVLCVCVCVCLPYC
jgi:hypothetical protein